MSEPRQHSPSRRTGADADVVSRERLVAAVLERPEPLVVLEAPLGMGKSVLLREIARTIGLTVATGTAPPRPGATLALWDIPPGSRAGALPEAVVAGEARLILAKRPETRVPRLDRAIAYGRAFVFGTRDLLFRPEDLAPDASAGRCAEILERTKGWPMLVGSAGRQVDESRYEALFGNEFLSHLRAEDLVWMDGLLATPSRAACPPPGLAPLVDGDNGGVLGLVSLRGPLTRAVAAEIGRRVGDAGRSGPLIEELRAAGRVPDAVIALQGADRHAEALALLADEKGFLSFYRFGPAAFERMLAGFADKTAPDDETLNLCRCLLALKHGDVARTREIISDRFGAAALDPAVVFAGRAAYSLPFRLFRVLVLLYEDIAISDAHLEQMFALIGEVPADAHIERGTFFNAVLEFYIRRRDLAEAEDVAQRALYHYGAAEVPILQFYIRLHQSVIRLMQGDCRAAQRLAEAAAGHLRDSGFDSPGDARLLALLTACVEYESGNAGPLARFLSYDLADFSHAELWPTVVDLALHYGSQALGEQFSTIAARSFLDRWRVNQMQNHQFQAMLDLREAAILQNGNRWFEAGEVLSGVMPGIERAWAMSPAADLARVEQRDMLALALGWLKQITFELPTRDGLPARLDAILANRHLTGRQRLGVDIWRAYVYRHRRDFARSRKILERVLDSAGHLGAVAPLAEERYFLDDLLSHKRLQAAITLSDPAQQIMRRLRSLGVAMTPPGARSALTRRETKVLLMISDGSSNKFIANVLGISESTVKFHLRNLYRKLGCCRRREAIAAARGLQLVS